MKYLLILIISTLSLQAEYHHIQALQRDLKLKPEISGRILMTELNCSSCHKSDLESKQAPVLDGSEKRLQPSFIAEFLENPQKVKNGTTMPDVLHSLPAAEKKKAAEALAAYLTQDGFATPLKGDKSNGKE